MERIPADTWQQYEGHVARYLYAASRLFSGESVNDIACGVGYGAEILAAGSYRGYDRPGVPDTQFSGTFFTADLNDPAWRPELADAAVCFETLEHVTDPWHLAEVICETTRRIILVSAPVVPTKHLNEHHLHDFTTADVPPMFPGFQVVDDWDQPSEFSHVWTLTRSST